MAEVKTVALVPLNGLNYSTWKVQCRMALMKDGLWTIVVDGTEASPLSTKRRSTENFLYLSASCSGEKLLGDETEH